MSEYSEYLVEIVIDTGDLDPATVDGLRAAEAERARELFARGSIISLWRVPGRWANLGLWRAPNEPRLMELLDSLPLRPYMSVQVRPLEPHPSDPRQDPGTSIGSAAGSSSPHVLSPLPELTLQSRVPAAPTRAARRKKFELAPMSELSFRTRTDRKDNALAASAPETQVTPKLSPALSSSSRQNGRQLFSMWVDADVTDLLRHTSGEPAPALRELIFSQAFSTLSSYPELIDVAADGTGAMQIVHAPGERGLYAATIAAFQGNGTTSSANAAEDAKPLMSITDSGALGIGGYVATGDDAPLQLNIGPIIRSAVVRNLPDGGEGIQVRSVVRILLNVTTLSASPESAGSFLAALVRNYR